MCSNHSMFIRMMSNWMMTIDQFKSNTCENDDACARSIISCALFGVVIQMTCACHHASWWLANDDSVED